MCLWSPLLQGFQSGVHYADDGTRIHLTVEAMPGGARWEWLAWIARNPGLCRHGHALSAASARRVAEDAAAALDRRGAPATAAAPAGFESGRGADQPADRRRTARSPRPARLHGQVVPFPGAAPGLRLRPPRR